MLIRLFLCYFLHRMDIRCFLTGFFGQEDEPSELLQSYRLTNIVQIDLCFTFSGFNVILLLNTFLFLDLQTGK